MNEKTKGKNGDKKIIAGKVKTGNWSTILSAALGLQTTADVTVIHTGKENLRSSTDRSSVTSTNSRRSSPAQARKKNPKFGLKGSQKGSQKGIGAPSNDKLGAYENMNVDQRAFSKRKGGALHTHKETVSGKDPTLMNTMETYLRSKGISTSANAIEDQALSASIFSPRCLLPSEIIAMRTRLRFHEIRKEYLRMLPIEHRVSDALAGYFISKIEDVCGVLRKPQSSSTLSF